MYVRFTDNGLCAKACKLIHTGGQTVKRTEFGVVTLTLDSSVRLEELRRAKNTLDCPAGAPGVLIQPQ